MGKRDPVVPPVSGQAVPGIYVPRSVQYYQTHDNTKPYTDLDMIDYGKMLQSGQIKEGDIRGRAQHDYEAQMGQFEGKAPRGNSGQAVTTGATTGAALGSTIGNAIPGVGTAIGAAAGTIAGTAAGMFAGNHGPRTTQEDRNRWSSAGGTLDQNAQQLMAERGFGGQPSYGEFDPQIQAAADNLQRKRGNW